MIATTFAIACTFMGALSMVGSVVRGSRREWEKSNENEKCGVLWFLLAAVLLK